MTIKTWTTGKGQTLELSKMDYTHLKNVSMMLQKQIKKSLEQLDAIQTEMDSRSEVFDAFQDNRFSDRMVDYQLEKENQ